MGNHYASDKTGLPNQQKGRFRPVYIIREWTAENVKGHLQSTPRKDHYISE